MSTQLIKMLVFFFIAVLADVIRYSTKSGVISYLLSTLNCCKQPGDVSPRPRPRAGAHLAPAGVQVVAVGGEEQVGEASVVAGGQQGKQGAILAGVKAGTAGVRAAGVHGHAGAEAKAGDDATLALLLHCRRDERARVWPGGTLNVQSHAFLITSLKGKKYSFETASARIRVVCFFLKVKASAKFMLSSPLKETQEHMFGTKKQISGFWPSPHKIGFVIRRAFLL